jgi:hypothetical protein
MVGLIAGVAWLAGQVWPAAGPGILASALAVALAAAVAGLWAGAVRGPVMGDPFAVMATMDAAGPDARAVRRRFRRAAVRPVAAAPLVWAGVAVAGGAAVSPGSLACGAAFALMVGLIAGVAWLAGQVWPAAGRAAGGSVACAALALAVFLPDFLTRTGGDAWLAPLFALGLPGASAWTARAIGAVAVLALAGVMGAPRLARRLTLPGVLEQALAWEAAGLATMSGWASEALAAYRQPPARAWGRAATRRGSWFRAFVRADLVGLLRTPGRTVAGAAGLMAAGWAAGTAVLDGLAGAVPPGPLGAVAACAAYAALGPFTDGLRDWAAELKGQVTMGVGPGRLAAARLAVPLAAAVLLAGFGAVVGSTAAIGRQLGASLPMAWQLVFGSGWNVLGDSPGLAEIAPGAIPLALWAAVPVAARLRESLRGAPPAALSVPTPTPMGDPAPLIAFAWHFDSFVFCGLFGWLAAGIAAAHPVTESALAAAFLVLLTWSAMRRARSHLRPG